MEESQKVNNSIGWNDSIVWKSKKSGTQLQVIVKTKKPYMWALETKKAAEPLGIGEVGFVFSAISSVLFSISCSENSNFSRTKDMLIEWLDSNNQAGLSKHHIGWPASKINNRTDPN